jgi:hypothetical protein
MQLTLTIDAAGEAFTDEPATELARCLDRVAGRIRTGATEGNILDANGNTCGSWAVR